MKYFFIIIILFLTSIPILSAQSNLIVLKDTAATIALQPIQTSSSGQAVTSVTLPQPAHADFITIAVYTLQKYDGAVYYQTPDRSWTLLKRYHEASHPDREIFELITLPAETGSIQIKTEKPLFTDLKLRWFAPVSGLFGSQHLPAGTRDECSCPQPGICGRDCWCPSGDCPQDATPAATAPSHIIVHHSAAHSTSDDFSAVVRSYWDFHVNVNGWDDIGYNWLVDGDGVIYEGRGSGVRGAHFSCMNAETTGICMIGNFETATPSSAALSSLDSLIAWESCDKGIHPADSSIHVTAQVPLAHISGHRDGNDLANSCTNTVCPGANLYPLLPAIRSRVSEAACLQVITGLSDITKAVITVYPNPGNGHFFISPSGMKISSINIRSVTGALLENFNKKNIPENNTTDETAFTIATSGLYFVIIEMENGKRLTQRVLVRR